MRLKFLILFNLWALWSNAATIDVVPYFGDGAHKPHGYIKEKETDGMDSRAFTAAGIEEWPADEDDAFYTQAPRSSEVLSRVYAKDGAFAKLEKDELNEAVQALVDAARLELTWGGTDDVLNFLKRENEVTYNFIRANKRLEAMKSFYTYWKGKISS